ncbi:hypothetical protein B0T26DRAFT_676825 [Lasiosphaeria miniovina]|uniref:Heterokaryon incompatibility domain-containing protein n=1 Tax=Lasiosphaeria miniovina TaxID=1954250 RepID=A0AA40AAJ9_9PEZI|nr:uncharacterized protein B0T26DRAFT_676825 [Lasiosphaeria miniovina]KAK0712350.1 hypothetical protein B0T26DRAFT_676825 [Lasiosphaeria miniovina]
MLERDPDTGHVHMKTFKPAAKRDPKQLLSEMPLDPKLRSIKELQDRERVRPKDKLDLARTPPFLRVGPLDPILIPAETDRSSGCRNAEDDRAIPRLVPDVIGAIVNTESPLMNQLFQLCQHAQIHCCENPACSKKRSELAELAPECDWAPFRDWALQLMACQLTMIDQGNFTSPVLRMSHAVMACHFFLVRVRRDVSMVPSTKLAGPNKTTRAVDAFGAFETIYWMMTIEHSLDLLAIIEQTWDPGFLPGAITDPDLTKASQRAAEAGICPNRFWNLTVAMEREHLDIPAIAHAAARYPQLKHEGHEACTPTFCTFTVLDSTRVKQCHKCSELDDDPCKKEGKPLFFDPKKLDESIRSGKRTVWSTAPGEPKVSQEGPYVAISHVWSDGTGVGLHDPGKVNECLFRFLARVVKRIGYDAIWWDAISIPKDAQLRQEEINNMHRNYGAGECTLLHDNYLLNFEWADNSEGPCLALVLCPWFTRGWTALELIMSKAVKVLYKNPVEGGEPLIKDLDEEILATDPARCTRAHWIASTIIRRLRREISNVSDLAAILKPRSTSWARDRMVIAGLLAKIKVDYTMATHEITKAIIDRVWNLHPDSLLHGQPTITTSGGWSWCPHSLYDMPSTTVGDLAETGKHLVGDRTCVVDKSGVISTSWYWRALEEADTRHDLLIPNSLHQAVSVATRHAIRDWQHCMLLREANMDGGLGLIVKPVGRRTTDGFIPAQYVGSVRVRESPEKLQGTPVDARYAYNWFRIGEVAVPPHRARRAVAFYSKHNAQAPISKSSSNKTRDCSWIAGVGNLWMGDHPHEGQLLICRHRRAEGDVEGLRLVVSGDHEKKTYALLPAEEPVFRVRLVKYQEQWPPEPIPAFGRVYHSDAVPAMNSFSIFRLETDGKDRTLYALLIQPYLVPNAKQPYGGMWIYVRPDTVPLVTLFYQQHPSHLQAITLTGDTSIKRGSLIFVVDDLNASKDSYPGEGEWKGMPYVEIPWESGCVLVEVAEKKPRKVVILKRIGYVAGAVALRGSWAGTVQE